MCSILCIRSCIPRSVSWPTARLMRSAVPGVADCVSCMLVCRCKSPTRPLGSVNGGAVHSRRSTEQGRRIALCQLLGSHLKSGARCACHSRSKRERRGCSLPSPAPLQLGIKSGRYTRASRHSRAPVDRQRGSRAADRQVQTSALRQLGQERSCGPVRGMQARATAARTSNLTPDSCSAAGSKKPRRASIWPSQHAALTPSPSVRQLQYASLGLQCCCQSSADSSAPLPQGPPSSEFSRRAMPRAAAKASAARSSPAAPRCLPRPPGSSAAGCLQALARGASFAVTTGPCAGLFHDAKLVNITVGRTRTSKFQIKDASISEKHAELYLEGETWFVRDVGSTNGTNVNGRPIGDQGGGAPPIGQTSLASSVAAALAVSTRLPLPCRRAAGDR